MKEIALTQGQVVKVDDSDYEWLNKIKWHAHWAPNVSSYYAVGGVWLNGRSKTIIMHRLILDAPVGQWVDHVDRETLNNQRSNLRMCSHSQSNWNTRKRSNNTSGYKGVDWHKAARKWRAKIRLNGRLIYLGVFSDIHEAVLTRDEAVKKMHGEFGVLNFNYRPLSDLTD